MAERIPDHSVAIGGTPSSGILRVLSNSCACAVSPAFSRRRKVTGIADPYENAYLGKYLHTVQGTVAKYTLSATCLTKSMQA